MLPADTQILRVSVWGVKYINPIGKLTSTVDHLGATVDKLGGKVDKLSHQATWVKGGLAVGLVLITIVVGVGSWLVNSNFVAILQALRGLQH